MFSPTFPSGLNFDININFINDNQLISVITNEYGKTRISGLIITDSTGF
jgi:hypothetical protein